MNEDVLIKIIVVCIGVATVALYYLNRRHRWKTYMGYTKGQITELKTRVKGTKCVCFEYVVDGRLYTGVTGTVMKAEEIVENNPKYKDVTINTDRSLTVEFSAYEFGNALSSGYYYFHIIFSPFF